MTGSPNYEVKPSYSFTVVATDAAGNASAARAVSLAITNLDEVAPVITSGATAAAIAENSAAGQVVYTATATDFADATHPDDAPSLPLAYSLGGADAALFSINGGTGEVKLTGSPNYEVKPSYSFTVVATDAAGNASAARAVSLAITNLDEVAPVITSGATAAAIAENSAAGQVVYTATATDFADATHPALPHSLPIAYSLGGADAAWFSINGGTGEVKLTGSPNYEAKPSYSFTVVATDAAGNASAARAVSLAITNLDEVAPVITSAATAAAIPENSAAGQVVYTATATDFADATHPG